MNSISITKEQYLELFNKLRHTTDVLDRERNEITTYVVECFVDDLALRDACIDEMQREMVKRDYEALAFDLRDAWHDRQAISHEVDLDRWY